MCTYRSICNDRGKPTNHEVYIAHITLHMVQPTMDMDSDEDMAGTGTGTREGAMKGDEDLDGDWAEQGHVIQHMTGVQKKYKKEIVTNLLAIIKQEKLEWKSEYMLYGS